MSRLLTSFILLFLLPAAGHAGHAGLPVPLYVNNDGNDVNNTCRNRAHPCRTIGKALSTVSQGDPPAVINLARGTYEDYMLTLPPQGEITITGGWNASFSEQTCTASGTILIGKKSYPSEDNHIIRSFYPYDAKNLSLNCLTMEKKDSTDLQKAVLFDIRNGTATFSANQLRITGFDGNSVIDFRSGDGGTFNANFIHCIFDQNNSSTQNSYGSLISLYSAPGGTLSFNMKKVSIIHNRSQSSFFSTFAISCSGTGTVFGSIENSIIAANNAGIEVSKYAGDISLLLANTTIADNLQWQLNIMTTEKGKISVTSKNSILLNRFSSLDDIQIYRGGNEGKVIFDAEYSILGDHRLDGENITYTSTHEIHGDPLLDSRYHLKKGSPAIDTGICGHWDPWLHKYFRIAPYDDIDGDKRPGDGKIFGCDIGADEYKPFPWPMFLPAIVHQSHSPYTIPTTPHF